GDAQAHLGPTTRAQWPAKPGGGDTLPGFVGVAPVFRHGQPTGDRYPGPGAAIPPTGEQWPAKIEVWTWAAVRMTLRSNEPFGGHRRQRNRCQGRRWLGREAGHRLRQRLDQGRDLRAAAVAQVWSRREGRSGPQRYLIQRGRGRV